MLILAHTAGISPVTAMLATVSATGFCQTLMISAKPVALFGRLAEEGYRAARSCPAQRRCCCRCTSC